MIESTILMIGNDPTLRDTVAGMVRLVEGLKLEVISGFSGVDSYPSWEKVSLVLIPLGRETPASEVARILRMLSALRRPVATLVVGEEDDDQAATLLRLGVADYLERPLDVDRLAPLIDILTVRSRNPAIAPIFDPSHTFESLPIEPIFDNLTLDNEKMMTQVFRVASRDSTIVISGESGTGRSQLASMIHDVSYRRSNPFIAVDCSSLPIDRLEVEMFGQARTSLATTDRDRPGKFAEVGRGTLFLHQIDALSTNLQAKLLRMIEDRIFEPVGSSQSIPFRARLIASSSRPLIEEVEAGRFRSDLYYRIHVIHFPLPTLRERRGLIPTLISKSISEFAALEGREVDSIAEPALRVMEEFDWPGNFRELRDVVKQAVSNCGSREIRLEDLPDFLSKRVRSPRVSGIFNPSSLSTASMTHSTLAEIKRDAELNRITEALEKHSNNRLRAASELGISRMTLYKKLYKYGLMQPGTTSRGG